MRTLILDIETVGEEWSTMDETTQAVLSRWIERSSKNSDEQINKLEDLKAGLGFSPLTGRIVVIGLYDLERAQGAVYYVAKENSPDEVVGNFILKVRSEAAMLKEFWEGAIEYDTFVTFNGRAFDLPFIIHRSIAHDITPTNELMKYRYLTQQSPPYHIDLQDQFTWYGAMTRRPSLHLFCRAFGVTSPKIDGVTGDDVSRLFVEKKFRDIALYNSKDVIATKELYEIWLKNLAPTSFINTIDL